MSVQPKPTVRVRPFMPADRDAVLGLAPRLTIGLAPWRDPDVALPAARKWITETIDAIGPERAVLVAEGSDGGCLGFVTVERDTHWTGEAQAYVPELVVAEVAEGRGVGRALMAGVEAWAKKQGFRVVELDTNVANPRARAFYARVGYAEESVKLVKVLPSNRR
jgi:GNAT superfamily N-acetyltransferase